MAYVNPETGKGWTPEEEAAFAALMNAGGMQRLPAIRMYRRFGCDLEKALRYATGGGTTTAEEAAYRRTKAKRVAGLAKGRQRRAYDGVSHQRSGG